MRRVSEEVVAAAGALAAVIAGSLLFVVLMMPFVFPFAFVAAIALGRRMGERGVWGSSRGAIVAEALTGRSAPGGAPARGVRSCRATVCGAVTRA